MVVHEIWEDPENNSHAMFSRRNRHGHPLSPKARLIHTFEAGSFFEAMRIHYRLMGFGEWMPPEGVADTDYTENDMELPE